jgi:hypothetical protein
MICANSVAHWATGGWRLLPELKTPYLLHEVLRGIQERRAEGGEHDRRDDGPFRRTGSVPRLDLWIQNAKAATELVAAYRAASSREGAPIAFWQDEVARIDAYLRDDEPGRIGLRHTKSHAETRPAGSGLKLIIWTLPIACAVAPTPGGSPA